MSQTIIGRPTGQLLDLSDQKDAQFSRHSSEI